MVRSGGQLSGGNRRFADVRSSWTYRFNFKRSKGAKIELEIGNQYAVSYSTNDWEYLPLLDAGVTGEETKPQTIETVDVEKLLGGRPGMLYLKFADCVPENGWGGMLSSIKISGTLSDEKPAEPERPTFAGNPIPLPKKTADVVDVFDCGREPKAIQMMLCSLQGIVAQTQPAICLSAHNFWFKELEKSGVKTEVQPSWAALLEKHKGAVKGYILCDSETWNMATTFAGIRQGLVVHEEIESEIKAFGLKKLNDVRGKDLRWFHTFLSTKAKGRFAINGIVNIKDDRLAMRDWAIANKFIYVHSGLQPNILEKFYQLVAVGACRYGWNDPVDDEFGDVNFAGERGLFTIPTDHTQNLTLISALADPKLFRAAPPPVPAVAKIKNKHIVTILVSDGDNLNLMLEGYRDTYFGSSRRGEIPLGWMVPSSSFDLCPTTYKWYCENATDNDVLLGALSGPGYVYPSKMRGVDAYAKLYDFYNRRAGLKYGVIMDLPDSQAEQKEVFSQFLNRNSYQEGLFFIDYSNYAKWKGDAYLIDGKPVVSLRYILWEGQMSPEEIKQKLAASPTDPSSPESYSVIMLHLWSYNPDEIVEAFSDLPENVELVRPDLFLNMIKEAL